MSARQVKFCGWGYEGEGLDATEEKLVLGTVAARFGVDGFERKAAPKPDDITLPAPRVAAPGDLAGLVSADHRDRLLHTYGQSYPDYVRMFARDFAHAPDLVGHPESEEDVAALIDWAGGANVAVIPFGGGTSVVGGVEPAVGDGFAAVMSLDLTGLDRVLEIDRASRAVRVQGGMRTPALEAALKPHGLTLRHFPQSFEMATVGGMIATRSGGHFATLYTHIDDFVEATRSVTGAGIMETRRLPGSGAGPSPDRLMIGSEGSLGVITEAWLRLQDRPTHRASTAILFDDFFAAAECVRQIAQSGLYPANTRLLDQNEALVNGFGDGRRSVVVLGFESHDHPVDAWMNRGLEICRANGGHYDAEAARDPEGHKQGAAGAWRSAFIKMPHFRTAQVANAIISDTFETAITWDRFREFHENVMAATTRALHDATGRAGIVTCRFTHAYPDGAAPYYSFHALGRHGALMEQWTEIKKRASDAVIEHGGTITHHHAVGRDHMPWYARQRPALFGAALKAVKGTLDPHGIFNPGVVVT
ncbi:FAD-binding oxidoreductase [Oceanibacterium hippocampi]|uniref:Putative FAD-linked oxidoreductase n=1 Tax=Oceanibacterium hippocampi TaxID=745714 RepID=A0A1Y5S152_9PROT|nr:FAD-binding oxidoreductase [Oceanibacterium hippocampi]SLN30287.1 putative FAD-linked oxidoreductase [Oceanibacterium hippocampi]